MTQEERLALPGVQSTVELEKIKAAKIQAAKEARRLAEQERKRLQLQLPQPHKRKATTSVNVDRNSKKPKKSVPGIYIYFLFHSFSLLLFL